MPTYAEELAGGLAEAVAGPLAGAVAAGGAEDVPDWAMGEAAAAAAKTATRNDLECILIDLIGWLVGLESCKAVVGIKSVVFVGS